MRKENNPKGPSMRKAIHAQDTSGREDGTSYNLDRPGALPTREALGRAAVEPRTGPRISDSVQLPNGIAPPGTTPQLSGLAQEGGDMGLGASREETACLACSSTEHVTPHPHVWFWIG